MLLKDALGFNINNTGRDLILLLSNEFSQYRITSEQWTVLKSLEERDGINVKELVNRVRKDQANVTRILDILEQREYVKRIPNPNDKRSSLILLTPKGITLIQELIPLDEKVQKNALNGITDEELTLFRNVLSKISDNIHKEISK